MRPGLFPAELRGVAFDEEGNNVFRIGQLVEARIDVSDDWYPSIVIGLDGNDNGQLMSIRLKVADFKQRFTLVPKDVREVQLNAKPGR